jgi:tetratricopeptide (TPR) repeat protein
MDYYNTPDFQMRIFTLIHEGKMDMAIDEITGAVREAEKLKAEDDVCYLYSSLAGIYFVQEKIQDALAVLEECEAKHPNSVLAKFVYLENLFWHVKDYEQTVQKAEAVMALVQIHLNYYHKSLHLKGLAHVELKQFEQAVEILKQTEYYDLSLVEKLMARKIGTDECREFLLKALDRNRTFQARGEDVADEIRRIEALILQLDR